jgi:uncharacterized protein YozE (UPF0346 family)
MSQISERRNRRLQNTFRDFTMIAAQIGQEHKIPKKKNQFLVFSSHVRWIPTFIQNLMQDELQTQNTVGKQRNWHK